MKLTEKLGQPLDRAGVPLGISSVELGIPHGDGAELDKCSRPGFDLAVALEVLEQRQHACRAGRIRDQTLVLGGALIDAVL